VTEFVEFAVHDPERFRALQRVFQALKKDKDAARFRNPDEWLGVVTDEVKARFAGADERAREAHDLAKEIDPRPIRITPTSETLGLRWDFFSMIDAFENGEYELRSCEMVGASVARWSVYALAYPYGGVGCMVALIEAHGFRVTGIDDGTGYMAT
jgi:hypothetical protein